MPRIPDVPRTREKRMREMPRAGGGRSTAAGVGQGRPGGVVAALVLTLLVSAATPPESPVADAAMRGDHGSVRALLQQGADVNAAQGDGMTALHWAADRGDLEMARMLVYAGAGLEAVTRMAEYTPLHLASRAGHGTVVRALLEAGSDPAAPTASGGATPLHLAAAAGDPEAVAALVEHGAHVDARERRADQTPLIFAAAQNRVEAIQALLAGGADPSLTTRVVDMVELEESLRGGQDDQVRQQIAAQIAAREAKEKEGEPEEKPAEAPKPLSMGQQVGHMGGMTALLHAARQGHMVAVGALLDAGGDIDQASADGTTPLFIAALNGHFDLVMELLEAGADPNLANDAGGAPLFATINQQWIPKTGYAQPNAHLQQNTTHLEVMEALLRAGADPNMRLAKRLWFTQYGGSILSVNMIGATPVLARVVRGRRRGDEAAGGVRRRSPRPDAQAAPAPPHRLGRGPGRGQVGDSRGPGWRTRHPSHSRRLRRGLRAGLRGQRPPPRARRLDARDALPRWTSWGPT